jgi:cysteinyl-tRNA synthetase
MSVAELGPTFDIHGGGKDLIFPHHENEIAQSCAYTGKEFARYWVHNGFVTVDKEKMSKSLGNFFTIREIFDKSPVSDSEAITGECLRYYLLSTHYRSDLNFSEQSLPEAKAAMDTIYGLIQRLEESDSQESKQGDEDWEQVSKHFAGKFRESMDDDFNTPKVLGAFHELRSGINKLLLKGLSEQARKTIIDSLRKYGKPLGLFQLEVTQWNGIVVKPEPVVIKLEVPPVKVVGGTQDENAWIEQQINLRNEARAKKDFATADKIRQELDEKKITLEDRPDGTTRWKR